MYILNFFVVKQSHKVHQSAEKYIHIKQFLMTQNISLYLGQEEWGRWSENAP